jgi:hypothetical protein
MDIEASSLRTYDVVADMSRTGEWSPECHRCEWIEGADGPAEGARFRGHNHIGPVRRVTTGTVKVADPGREFSFSTEERVVPWIFAIESYEAIWSPPWVRFADLFVPRRKQLARGMRTTLDRIRAAIEAQPE